jgi:sporulation protein YlmC with PRC-barrel domain
MSNKRSLARGLLVVMVIGLMTGYVLGAQQSTNENPQQSVQPGQQTSQMPGRQQTQQMQVQALTLARTDKLIGKDVKDAQGQTAGKIEDIVLAPSLDQVSYIALESDGKYYAVPWSALHQGPGETYTLSISKQDLTKAQSFNRDRWPAQANMQLLPQSQRGMASSPQEPGSSQQATEPSQQRMAQGQPSSSQSRDVEQRRVTKLMGIQVRNREGADIGNIKGFVIDLGGASSGRTGSQARAGSDPQAGSAEPNQTGGQSRTSESQQAAGRTGYGEMTPSQRGQWSSESSGTAQQVRSGKLIFTILSFGGVLGVGEKYSLVPSNLVNIQPARRTAMLNATKQTVESLAFSPRDFPNLSNRQYVRQVYQTFGEQPYWSALGYVSPEQQQQAGEQSQQGQTGEMGQGQTGQNETGQSDAESNSNR